MDVRSDNQYQYYTSYYTYYSPSNIQEAPNVDAPDTDSAERPVEVAESADYADDEY